MDRVLALLVADKRIRRLNRKAAAAIMAGLIAVLIAGPAAHARQTLQIDGELAQEVEDQLDEVLRSAQPLNAEAASLAPAATRRVLALLRSEGYYGASVQAAQREAGPIIYIRPGLRFGIEAIEAKTRPSNAEADAVALAATGLEPGAPLRAETVIAAEARALAALQEEGWPDAALLERQVVVDHNTAQGRVRLNFEAGAFSRYGDIRLADPDWREAFIRRLAPVEQGEVVQLSALRRYQARLTALDGVARASVALADPEASSEARDIRVELEASARNIVEAGFGLSTSEGGGVGATWTRRNLFGGDETLQLSAKLLTLEQSIESRLSAPHWRRLDQTLTLIALAGNEETDAFDRQGIEAEIDITRRLSPVWRGGVQLGLDISQLSTNGEETDTVLLFTGVTAVYDRRDSATDPTAGVRAAFQITPALALGDLQSGYVLGETTLQTYRRLGDRAVAAGRVRVGGLVGASVDAVPADERFYAGGGGSVRGFEYQSLSPTAADGRPTGGRSVVEASAELRWRGPGRWGAAVFADAGLASSDVRLDLSDLRVGVGAGLRYHFAFAPLRVDIAAPLDRRSDEASLHVYVGLGQAF